MNAVESLFHAAQAIHSIVSRTRGVAAIGSLLGALFVMPMAHAQTPPPFGNCPIEAYQTIQVAGTYNLYTIDVGSGTLTAVGSDTELQGNNGSNTNGINAIGFNDPDRYIYGWNNSVHQFVRVGSDGSAEFIGPTPAGMGSLNAVVGDVYNNHAYLWAGNKLYDVDLTTNTLVLPVTNTTGVGGITDWAYNAADGQIYYIRNSDGALMKVDPVTGVGAPVSPGVNVPTSTAFGAQYLDNQGSLYASRNDGTIFRVRNATGGGTPSVEVLTTAAPATSQNDGARCPSSAPPVASVSVTKALLAESGTITGRAEPGETLTYRFTLANSGLAASGATYPFFEALPVGTTLLSVSGGTVDCPIGSAGSRLCTITESGAIPPGGSATVDMQLQVDNPVPAGLASILNLATDDANTPPPGCSTSNQPCTTPPSCSPTSDPKHCVVTPFPSADLVVTKDNGSTSVASGSTTTYTVAVTNNGPDAATGAVVKDSPGANLSCPGANTVTCTGAACPAGPLTVSSLASGVTLGTLTAIAPNNTVSFSFSCTVQ